MSVRRVPDVDERMWLEHRDGGYAVVRREFVAPVPVGILIARIFRVTGWGRDCDGSALAELAEVDVDGQATGWEPFGVSVSSRSSWIVESAADLDRLAVNR